MSKVILTGPAKRDIRAVYEWWKEHRSAEQADRWYRGILDAARSLRTDSGICTAAPEADLLPQGVKQSLYGLGRQPTHRLVFTIDEGTIVILRVRHTSQDILKSDELRQ